jgi:CheY-like chemotaxis protein
MIVYLEDEDASNLYRDEFIERGIQIIVHRDVTEGWNALAGNADVDVVILDVMMPPGKMFDLDSTKQGLLTGIHFYRRLRAQNAELPIFILTNNTDPEISEAVAGDTNAYHFVKTDVYPDDFADRVISKYSERGGRPSTST